MKRRNKSQNPFYRKPAVPSYSRRAFHHDYTRTAKYMITLKKRPEIPVLSTVSGNPVLKEGPEAPIAIPTPTGALFEEALRAWPEKYPQLKIHKYVIMPDHIHFCLEVTANLEVGLSRAMSNLMGRTTSIYRKSNNLSDISFFQKGFNDSIAYNPEQFEIQKQYIGDNPRRLIMKRLHPDLYFCRWLITVGSLRLIAIGNIYLLKNPHLTIVRFSRKFSKEQLEANHRNWLNCIENGGALISPFIHPIENDMRKYAIENGGAVIKIRENGFSERFSPSGADFDLLAEGRLLFVGPTEYKSEKEDLTYRRAQQLNAVAEIFASYPTDMTIRRLDS